MARKSRIPMHIGPFDIELDRGGAKDVYVVCHECAECGNREIVAEFRRKDHAVKWAKDQFERLRLSKMAESSLRDVKEAARD